jgi:hypothetical protein
MSAPKSNARVVKDVNALVASLTSRNARNISQAAIAEAIAKNRARSAIAGGVGAGNKDSGGAIASPLSEIERNFFSTPRVIQTTDGFFTFELRDIESFVFQDANGSQVVMSFSQPPDTF